VAALLSAAKRPQEAAQALRDSAVLFEKLAAETNAPDYRRQLAWCVTDLGARLHRTGHLPEAEKFYAKALSVWEKMVADFPTVADYRGHYGWCWHRLANLLETTGRHNEAEQACRQVLVQWDKMVELAPNLIGFHVVVAWNWVTCPEPKCRNARRAIEILEACVKKAPADGDAWNALGVAYYRAGDWKAASRNLEKGMELRRSGNSFDWFFLAMTRWQMGKKDEAAKWSALGLRWMQEHSPKPGVRFGDAQYDYEDLLRIRSEATALLGLPEQAPPARQGETDDLEIANLIVEADPSAACAYGNRGRAYAGLGQWDKAAADYSKAVELEPENPTRWLHRATLHAEQAKWDSAIADFRKAIQLDPNDATMRYLGALASLSTGRVDEYRKGCAEMLQRLAQAEKPGDASWLAWTCVILPDAVADWSKVVALAEKEAAAYPDSLRCVSTFGAALYRAGRFEEAVARLAEAERLIARPSAGLIVSPAYTWLFLAMAHHRLGHAEDARKWLGKAVEWLDQEKDKHAAGTVPMPWNRRVTLQLLHGEAETLIKGATAGQKPKQ
jgi:tetratricopeptide (TPR) repeat protein